MRKYLIQYQPKMSGNYEVNSLINVCLRKDFIDGLSTEREATLVNNNLSKIDN